MPREEPPRKVCEKPAPYNCKSRPLGPKADTPQTSARAITMHRQNLTLSDWLVVFQFIDEHPNVSQSQVVLHFKTHKEGALFFNPVNTFSKAVISRRDTVTSVTSHICVTVTITNISHSAWQK